MGDRWFPRICNMHIPLERIVKLVFANSTTTHAAANHNEAYNPGQASIHSGHCQNDLGRTGAADCTVQQQRHATARDAVLDAWSDEHVLGQGLALRGGDRHERAGHHQDADRGHAGAQDGRRRPVLQGHGMVHAAKVRADEPDSLN